MKKITVLGNFSGRNAGDNAILGNLLDDISEKIPDVKFLIPTFNASFVNRHFGHHNIKALGLLPWNGAFKIFGYPTYKAMTEADLVLITDNILFDRKYFNPLFNYLSTIALFAPSCRKRGIPIVPYNASLGPITTEIGKKAMQKVLDASPFLSLRDEQSRNMMDLNGLKYKEIIEGADCAINTRIPPKEVVDKIADTEDLFQNTIGTLSFNINAYIDSWQKLIQGGQDFGRERFVKLIAAALDKLIDELKVDIMMTVTQVMDMKIVNESLQHVKNKKSIKIISNNKYTYQQITGLLNRAGLHVGMRTHSLILSAAAFTPMVTINAYPKSSGFVKTIGQGDWIINFENLSVENLTNIISQAWEKRYELKKNMEPLVKGEQQKAKDCVNYIKKLLN